MGLKEVLCEVALSIVCGVINYCISGDKLLSVRY